MASVAFFPRRRLDFSGKFPHVSCNNDGWVVLVYNVCGWFSSDMYAIVGKIEGDAISLEDSPEKIGTGSHPKVAVNDNNVVVEVHGGSSCSLCYRVGKLNESKKLLWGERDYPLGGVQVIGQAVALSNNGTVVIAYHHSGTRETSYRVGKVVEDRSVISAWMDVGQELFNVETSISGNLGICMNKSGIVVAAAQSPYSKIIFRVGNLENDTIQWWEVDEEASTNTCGRNPSVAISKENKIFSVCDFSGKLFINYGILSSKTKKIEWHEPNGKPFDYGAGLHPSIALAGEDILIRIHNEGFWENQIVYDIGKLMPMAK